MKFFCCKEYMCEYPKALTTKWSEQVERDHELETTKNIVNPTVLLQDYKITRKPLKINRAISQ